MAGLLNDGTIPKEATRALEIILDLLGSDVVGVYLFGSAVVGGLRVNSDVDVLAVVNRGLSESTRRELIARLLSVSGRVGNADGLRPLEVTVVNRADVVPWRYPPMKELIYGEWLRDEYEQGQIPGPTHDPDLAVVLSQVRATGISLLGPDASNLLDPVPVTDVRRAMIDSLPELLEGLKGDERNVILTLARMWQTVATGGYSPKDAAAEWAMPLLPREQAAVHKPQCPKHPPQRSPTQYQPRRIHPPPHGGDGGADGQDPGGPAGEGGGGETGDDGDHEANGADVDGVQEGGGPRPAAQPGHHGVEDGDEQERGGKDAQGGDDRAGHAGQDVADKGGRRQHGPGRELAQGDGVQELLVGQPAQVADQAAFQKGDEDVAAAIEHASDL